MSIGIYKRTKRCNDAHKGWHHSNKAKKRMSKSHLGQTSWNKGEKLSKIHRKKLSISHQGQCPWIKGKKHSKKTKIKMRIAHLGIKLLDRVGKKHYNWNPNREKVLNNKKYRTSCEYRNWRKSVKNRDNWKCKINNKDCCGKIIVHHILGWTSHPELRYEINNGITLCQFHHPRKRIDETILSPFFKNLVSVNSVLI